MSIWKAFGFGFITGHRSLMGIAWLARAAKDNRVDVHGSPFSALKRSSVANTIAILAGGEVVADKLPGVPDRIQPPVFAARIGLGALCGAIVGISESEDVPQYAMLGGVGAVVGTLAGYYGRRYLTTEVGVPDFEVALVEDAIAISLGAGLAHTLRTPAGVYFHRGDEAQIHQEAVYSAV
ncbi:MAG TPA: hypothetical protein VGC88_01310 [Terriglobales bacterium]|jgi:uncharacterized membrane protein